MTQNQIAYANYKETKRNNEAVLAETNRHNIAGEQFNIASLAETGRHNKAQESIGYGNLAETSRHNMAGEQIDLSKLAESRRHNKATESQASAELTELIRANKAREANLAAQLQNDINSLAENVRHNKTSEMIQNNANDVRADLNRITESYNDSMAQIRLLEYASKSNLESAQKDKIRAEIKNMQEVLAVQKQNLDLAIKSQDWKQANDIAKTVADLLIAGLQIGTKKK